MSDALKAVGLLIVSNTFMTTARYGHLRFKTLSMPVAILVSWGIALFEYMAQVPANRIGYRVLSAYQLKVIQECITLIVFIAFAAFWLDEAPRLRYLMSFALILGGAAVAFL
jgi:uncharacterized protein (DUF486 family)